MTLSEKRKFNIMRDVDLQKVKNYPKKRIDGGKKYYLILKVSNIYKIYLISMEQIYGGPGMRRIYYQKDIDKNLIVGYKV